MLDQNTDRMWYVIGAIVIGAAIIAMGLNIFDESFDNVGYMMSDLAVVADLNMSSMQTNENLVGVNDLEVYGGTLLKYDDSLNEWSISIHPNNNESQWWSYGLRTKHRQVYVPFGETFTMSYEIYIPSDVENVASLTDINNNFEDFSGMNSDNDLTSERRHNGISEPRLSKSHKAPRTELESGVWNKIWFTYSNTNLEKNPNKLPLYDYSYFGVRNDTGAPFNVKIRNVKGELHTVPTGYVPKGESV